MPQCLCINQDNKENQQLHDLFENNFALQWMPVFVERNQFQREYVIAGCILFRNTYLQLFFFHFKWNTQSQSIVLSTYIIYINTIELWTSEKSRSEKRYRNGGSNPSSRYIVLNIIDINIPFALFISQSISLIAFSK